jgi:hypothetical protein
VEAESKSIDQFVNVIATCYTGETINRLPDLYSFGPDFKFVNNTIKVLQGTWRNAQRDDSWKHRDCLVAKVVVNGPLVRTIPLHHVIVLQVIQREIPEVRPSHEIRRHLRYLRIQRYVEAVLYARRAVVDSLHVRVGAFLCAERASSHHIVNSKRSRACCKLAHQASSDSCEWMRWHGLHTHR